jgi:hypothetical protein
LPAAAAGPRDDRLNLSLGLVPRRDEQRLMVLSGQVTAEQGDRREVEGSVCDQFEDHRPCSCGSRRFDAGVRGVLGQMEHLGAVREHRRAALAEVEASCVDFGQRPDDARGGLALGGGKRGERRQEIAIRLRAELMMRVGHPPCVASRFLPREERRSRAIDRGIMVNDIALSSRSRQVILTRPRGMSHMTCAQMS